MATSLAIVRNSDQRVITIVRPDVPAGWTPPEGCTAVPDDQLPAGWQYAEDESPVPQAISARQARLWLIRHNITLAQVDAVIQAIPDALLRESVRVEWEYGTEVHRDSPFVGQLGPAIGLDATGLDAAFREAATL